MRQNEFKFNATTDVFSKFKRYVKTHDCPEVTLDLSSSNIFDALKFVVLSSAYHFQKYPLGKLKCRVASDEMRDMISNFSTVNLEFI